MNSFFQIIQKSIGENEMELPTDLSYLKIYFNKPIQKEYNTLHTEYLMHLYIYKAYYRLQMIPHSDCSHIYLKYQVLNEMLENIFITLEGKNAFLNLFCKVQKTYFGFSRLAQIFRYKRASIKNREDLGMNPIEESSKSIIKIYQNKSFFLFRVAELINILNMSLTNADNFFASPLISKNPYNNVPFNLSSLYYIYFSVKSSTFLMPTILHFFFLCNFNINKFADEHESLIRELSIKEMIYNSHHTFLYNKVILMLNSNDYTRMLRIHEDFPKEELINIMRPFLHMHYRHSYSTLSFDERNNLFGILFLKLKMFYKYNPIFWKKGN
jgi:hypothetical protein